ncbi:MAG: hypothetical protein SOX71_08935 [Candidatus Faecousia sp.]|nr:hypothetical protein [Candidatus Faecousia sp.]
MLFRKKIERACSYCAHGAKLDEDTCLCSKRGLKSSGDSCRKFKYDPCKRVPFKSKALDFSQFQDRDFSLGE